MSTLKDMVASLFQEEAGDDVDDDTGSNSSLDEIEMRLKRFRQGYRVMYEGPTMRTGCHSGFVDELARKNALKSKDLKQFNVPLSREAISKKIAEDYEAYVRKYQSSYDYGIFDFSDADLKVEPMDATSQIAPVPGSPESLNLQLSSDEEVELSVKEELIEEDEVVLLVKEEFVTEDPLSRESFTQRVVLKSCLRKAHDGEVKNRSRRVCFSETVFEIPFEHEVEVHGNPSYGNEFRSEQGERLHLTLEEQPNQKYRSRDNLIHLPHRNAAVRLSKRIEPSLIGDGGLENEVEENYNCLLQDVDRKRSQRISKWLICDSLLERLNAGALRNAVVSRVEFPRMPSCLIDKAMHPKVERFPKEFCQIFVSMGFDILLYHHDEKTKAHLRFITQLCAWLEYNIEGKRVDYCKDVSIDGIECIDQVPVFFYRSVSVVVITIPEIGDFSRDFADFNCKLRNHVRKIRSCGFSTRISILDWAEKVKNAEDQAAMNTVEGRIELLVEEMSLEYGLLVARAQLL